jgi:hypothetical protein
MRRNIVAEVAAELIVFGGCVATRREVYDDCIARGLPWDAADRFAFGPSALAADEPRPILTLAQVRAWEEQHA